MLVSLALSMMVIVSQSYAAVTFSWVPRLDSATATSLNISWDPAAEAVWYYLYYSETSWVGKGYDRQYPDFIEGKTSATLADLESGKTYFIALTALDQGGEESPYSTEVSFSTLWAAVEPALSVEWLKISDKKTLILDFSLNLDDDINAVRDIKLVDKKSWEELIITSLELDWEKSLKATLENDLVESTQYDITIISVFSKSGKNIEAGIDGLIAFTTPDVFTEATLNKNILEDSEINANNDLNSANPEIEETPTSTWETSTGTNAWVNVSNEELNKNTVNAVNATNELPTTGPEHILLLVLAMLMWVGIFFIQRKRQTN